MTRLNHQHLAPFDHLLVNLRCDDGLIGHLCLHYGASNLNFSNKLIVDGSEGWLILEDTVVDSVPHIKYTLKTGNTSPQIKEVAKSGVFAEQEDFVEALFGNPKPGM